jgi:flagellar biogenesis protein FliO
MGDQVLVALGEVFVIIFIIVILVFGVIHLIRRRKRNGKIKIRIQ